MLVGLPLVAPIGLSPLHILTLCGSVRVLVVSTEPLDDLAGEGAQAGQQSAQHMHVLVCICSNVRQFQHPPFHHIQI